MRSTFGLLVVLSVIVAGGVFAFNRMRQVPLVAPAMPPKTTDNAPTFAEAKQAAQAVKMAGPPAPVPMPVKGASNWAFQRKVELAFRLAVEISSER